MGKSWVQESKFFGILRTAPFILILLDRQCLVPRTSMITMSGLSSMPLSWTSDMMDISEAAAGKDKKINHSANQYPEHRMFN